MTLRPENPWCSGDRDGPEGTKREQHTPRNRAMREEALRVLKRTQNGTISLLKCGGRRAEKSTGPGLGSSASASTIATELGNLRSYALAVRWDFRLWQCTGSAVHAHRCCASGRGLLLGPLQPARESQIPRSASASTKDPSGGETQRSEPTLPRRERKKTTENQTAGQVGQRSIVQISSL